MSSVSRSCVSAVLSVVAGKVTGVEKREEIRSERIKLSGESVAHCCCSVLSSYLLSPYSCDS